ncbi:YsnF/AvaK domain-containing protein [Pyxidicoccus sp. MSG2]|uniref:YsnF/AvaK domain-containing protein n=1 Tax=Pyxidicoccus sp. MSG2 TaxID=2996790 RepID=UPI00226FC1B5|nr:YsnF/AvaK domain-containing protein [Pyxidicoccus sp. MSG2]MCY1019511.1 YsnF/AvaK domain-containing protein [Pyxidicoccus sp. MSG2]
MRTDVKEGMRVFTADGVKLGSVVGCGEDTFVIEGGLLRARDYVARYGDVVAVRDGEAHLGLTRDELSPGPGSRAELEAHRPESRVTDRLGETTDLVIPLAHEEALPRAVAHEVGHLRVHKVVRTEVKHFSIPVRREELVVERVQAGDVEGGASPGAAERGTVPGGLAPFEEATLVIPLHEEQVEFTRTARVWQEVTIARTTREELRQVHTTVRRETARVDEQGEVLHDGPLDGLHS